jgi:hypothetical protein
MAQSILPQFSDSPDPELPLPLYVARQWSFNLAYVDQNGNPSSYLYALNDWIKGLTGTSQPSRLVNELFDSTEELKAAILLKKLPYKATNNKTYQVDFTNAEGLYRIAQELRSLKSRPQLDAIKHYLAAAGVLVDEIRRDEDVAAELIEDLEARHKRIREQGKKKRINFVQTAKETHEKGRPNYAAMTNAEYQVLFGAAKDELVKTLGLTAAQAARFRDHISTLALQAIDAAETAGAIRMQQLGRKLTTPEQIDIVRVCAHLVAPGFWALANYLNVDLLSGRPRLESGLASPSLPPTTSD